MKLPNLPGYQYDELIGEGACGVAVRCTHQGRDTRVVKFLKAQSINPGMVSSCIRALSGKERHPGIAEVFDHNFSEYPYFYVSPYFGERDPKTGEWQSRSLDSVIGEIQPRDALRLIDQIAEGIAFAHRLEVIHGGLKPANIFLAGGNSPDQWQVKIADWGQGYLAGLQYLEMGDLGFYASPEQLDNGDPSHGAGKRWDVYAFGVIAFLLLTGRFPRLEQQYQAYLREIQGFSHVPASAFGTVLDQPERYVDWIVEEERVIWPNPATSESEAKRREVIERCLAVDPRERFPDMRDVVAAFADCDHHLALIEAERQATEGRHRVLKRAARWQRAAAAAAVLSLFSAAGGAFFFAESRNLKKELSVTREGAQQHVANIQKTIEATEDEKAQKQLELEAVKEQGHEIQEKLREEMRHQMRESKDLLVSSQDNGDRFFELVLENRDSDVPGFAEDRRTALAEAAKYYAMLQQIYGDAPEFFEPSAKAARFLGEIRFELGDFPQAESDFVTAKVRLEKVQAGAKEPRPDLVRNLAIVNTRLAQIAQIRKQPQSGLVALDDAVEYWLKVYQATPNDPEPAIAIAHVRVLQAEIQRQLGKINEAKTQLSEAIRILTALKEALKEPTPVDHKILGGLARATAATADLMRISGDTEGAADAYREASELYADAIELNAAVDDYQLGFAKTLTEVAMAEDNVEKLTAAAKVLAEVSAQPQNKNRTDIYVALSDCYGALANKQRDANQAASAMEWDSKAIEMLKPLVAEAGPAAPDELVYALAQRQCSLANLQSDRGNHAECRDTLRAANTLIEKLLAVDSTNPAYRRLYAQAQGQLGYASFQAGDKNAAKQHYETAQTQWEAYLSANPKDDQASQALEWVKSQLDSLT
ncbi:MAG: protein kinase [Verrucomicrobiae bacterium]|nr:protein kinase [Verrucomicrobiae bacterium]